MSFPSRPGSGYLQARRIPGSGRIPSRHSKTFTPSKQSRGILANQSPKSYRRGAGHRSRGEAAPQLPCSSAALLLLTEGGMVLRFSAQMIHIARKNEAKVGEAVEVPDNPRVDLLFARQCDTVAFSPPGDRARQMQKRSGD